MRIVYSSNTGHTLEYANMLGNKLKIDVINIKDIEKINDEEIIFMTWVFGSNLIDLSKILGKYKIKMIIGVGMTEDTEDNTKTLITINKIDLPFFYLRGGINYTKLKGIKKFMLKMVGKSVIKKNDPKERETIELFKNGGSFVSEKNLCSIIDYLDKN